MKPNYLIVKYYRSYVFLRYYFIFHHFWYIPHGNYMSLIFLTDILMYAGATKHFKWPIPLLFNELFVLHYFHVRENLNKRPWWMSVDILKMMTWYSGLLLIWWCSSNDLIHYFLTIDVFVAYRAVYESPNLLLMIFWMMLYYTHLIKYWTESTYMVKANFRMYIFNGNLFLSFIFIFH